MTDEQFSELKGMLAELLTRVSGVNAPPAEVGFMPDPVPGEGFPSYVHRVASGMTGPKAEQALRGSGSLIWTGGELIRKHSGDWKKAAWEFIDGDPNYVPDPSWGFSPGRPR
jgi:hypothetical protein